MIIELNKQYKYNKKPLLVFLISTLVTGILEYLTGYIIKYI